MQQCRVLIHADLQLNQSVLKSKTVTPISSELLEGASAKKDLLTVIQHTRTAVLQHYSSKTNTTGERA